MKPKSLLIVLKNHVGNSNAKGYLIVTVKQDLATSTLTFWHFALTTLSRGRRASRRPYEASLGGGAAYKLRWEYQLKLDFKKLRL
jgi:hypothetical protein